MQLQGKKIILGITGSIAAYKTPDLVRLLVREGASVKVIMTEAARAFVSELSLSTVSKNPVLHELMSAGTWNNHVSLGLWADAMVIAPCSANSLAKLAGGLCDNILNAVYLSARCPVFLAPAMDEDMWLHPATRRNIRTLESFGNRVLPVGTGELASGLYGPGRMSEPAEIRDYLIGFFRKAAPLAGKKVLVTAGPTYERLDPVRFIGNFSTGKMGIAFADAFAEAGANVTLVLGPTHLLPSQPGVELVRVESAEEMLSACTRHFPDSDISVLSAAVADYRPSETASSKIKKTEQALHLELHKNPDILATLGERKSPGQLLIGFALETDDGLANAAEKLQRKNADLILLNSLSDEGAGFGHDTNRITVISRDAPPLELPLQSKQALARMIVEQFIVRRYETA